LKFLEKEKNMDLKIFEKMDAQELRRYRILTLGITG